MKKQIFESHNINEQVQVKNRLVMSPMTTISGFENGMSTTDELEYYAARNADLGMVISACAYVLRNGKGFPGQLSITDDSYIPSLAKLAKTIKAKGAKAILQLYHGGGMCNPAVLEDKQPVAPSAIVVHRGFNCQSRAFTVAEIHELVEAFAQATRRAIAAGFDGVEIHGANHYLIHQFFSPITNHRTDAYGGSLENRGRLPLEILKAAVTAKNELKPEFIIGYRLSAEDKEAEGFSIPDTLWLVDEMAQMGVGYIHLSTATIDHRSWKEADADYALTRVANVINKRCTLIGVGYVTDEARIQLGLDLGADLVAMGRVLLSCPDFATKIKNHESVVDADVFDFSKNDSYLKLPDPMLEWLQSPLFKIKKCK